jgi:hypothetical protein
MGSKERGEFLSILSLSGVSGSDRLSWNRSKQRLLSRGSIARCFFNSFLTHPVTTRFQHGRTIVSPVLGNYR